jgi:hypothetical protein
MDEVLDNFSTPTPTKDRIQAPKSLPNFKVLNNSFVWSGFLLDKTVKQTPDAKVNIQGLILTKEVFRPPIYA